MNRYLIAVVMSAVLAIGLLVYGMAQAAPVAAQGLPLGNGAGPVQCTTTCQTDVFGRQVCTTVCH